MLSQRERSTDDEKLTGYLASAEIYMPVSGAGELFALAEYDSPEETVYTSATYLASLGGFRVGPTASYLNEGDYSRQAFGLSAAMNIGASTEVKVTGAWAEQTLGDSDAEDASYIELQIRTRF